MKPALSAVREEIASLNEEAGLLAAARARLDDGGEDPTILALNKVTLAALAESVYSGSERILLMIAREIDGSAINKSDRWHRDLIDRMRHPFGDREAILSDRSARLMDELRGFRHKVRTHYAGPLTVAIVRERSLEAEALATELSMDIDRFIRRL